MTMPVPAAEQTTIPSWGGRYEILGLLGRGGSAEVFEARDRLLGRRVAVKILRDGATGDPRAATRFRREARAAAALNHPNVVTVHDVGMDGPRAYIVMELVSGETLAELLEREGTLPFGRAAAIGRSIAEALACAHEAGIVHRDLKPRNVMLTSHGSVKVLDFGIAEALDRTPVDEPLGTAEYLSPEQAAGASVDGRSDLYSLGILLYEMLAGRPPFTGESALGLIHRHIHEDPPPLSHLRPDVPAAFLSIVDRCLKKKPGARYRDARTVARELRRVRDVSSAPTDPLPPARTTDPLEGPQIAEGVTRASGSRLKVAWAWALGALALAVAVIGLLVPMLGRDVPVAQARPRILRPATALQARGACGGFFKATATLSWRGSASSFADGYVVYRSRSPSGPYEVAGIVPGRDVVRFVDRGLALSETYYYRVRATSGSRLSALSGRARADTPFFCL